MEKRVLGNTGIEISPVGLGCMGFSHAYGEPTEKSVAIEMIRKAYDMGYTFFDTAECYTGINADGTTSYNEELVGDALREVRDKVDIAKIDEALNRMNLADAAAKRMNKPQVQK